MGNQLGPGSNPQPQVRLLGNGNSAPLGRPGRTINHRRFIPALAALLLVLALIGAGINSCTNYFWPDGTGTSSAPGTPGTSGNAPAKGYTVVRGDYINKIAERNSVNPEAVLLLNESYLKERYAEACAKVPESKRNDRSRKGLFCNETYNRPWGNTLMAGWTIQIPLNTAPKEIQDAVGNISGKNIAIVIDDTGSMSEDRQMAGQLYSAAVRTAGKNLTGIWLYADGKVRKYNDGQVEYLTTGSLENTFSALKEAANDGPDAIVLITDEPGDDWKWDEVKDLPPVIGHCIRDGGTYQCEQNLKKLAAETKGEYHAHRSQ
jgi:hypothetical protein